MEKNEAHELEAAAKSARKNKIANAVSAIIKISAAILARDPVLASDGGHDVGDADVHSEHEKELNANSSTEAKKFALRSAKKLGLYSLIGAGVEVAVENTWEFAPNHLLGFIVAGGSLALTTVLKRDAHRHTHDRAHSLRSHTLLDMGLSGVTFANASLLLSGVNVNPAYGVAAHVGLSIATSGMIYRHNLESDIPDIPPDDIVSDDIVG